MGNDVEYVSVDKAELKRLQAVDCLLRECREVIRAHQQTVETMLLCGSPRLGEWVEQEEHLKDLACRVDAAIAAAPKQGKEHE